MLQKVDLSDDDIKIAKVAIGNIFIWVAAWTPYAVISMIGCFGNKSLVRFFTFSSPISKLKKCF